MKRFDRVFEADMRRNNLDFSFTSPEFGTFFFNNFSEEVEVQIDITNNKVLIEENDNVSAENMIKVKEVLSLLL